MTIPAVALIGVGGYGRDHYRYLKQFHEAGKLRLAAAVIRPQSYDKYAETIAELQSLGAKIYPSDEALLAVEKIDLAVLPVGIEFHRPLGCKYLGAGVNVLLEKPVAGSLADVDALIQAEHKSAAFLAVGFQNMYGSDIHAIKNLILAGTYGKLRNISMRGAWGRSDAYYQRNNWAARLYAADGTAILDSPVNNAFAHFMNIALFCAGSSFPTVAHVGAMQCELIRARRSIESFDTCGIRLQLTTGVPVQLLLTHACSHDLDPEIRFDLETASIVWNRLGWQVLDASDNELRREPGIDCKHEMYECLLQRLADRTAPVYTLENAREHTRCIEQLHQRFPIQVLAPRQYEIRSEHDNQHEIPGIEVLFEQAYRQNLLPSEAGAAWSLPVNPQYI